MMELLNLKEKFNLYRYNLVCRRYYIIIQYIFYKLIGLSPWVVDTSAILSKNLNHIEEINLCEISYVGSYYNLCIFSFIGLSNIYFELNSSLPHAQSDSILTPAFRARLKFIAILCINFIPLIYVCRQKILIAVINRLKTTDQKLKKCENYLSNKNNKHIYFIFMVKFLCSATSTSILLHHSNFSFVTLLLRIYPDFIGGWVMIQFSTLLKVINKRFKSINATITKLDNIVNDPNQIKVLSEKEVSFRHETEIIKHAYVELCEVCDNVVDFYGLPLLISIIHYLTINIIRLYFIILSVLSIASYDRVIYICNGINFSLASFIFLILTSSVTATMKESKKTLKVISLLVNRCPVDSKIEKQLTKFSSDISHFQVEFTACDVIPLDRRLLLMIVGTIASYLVIVVQFRINSPSN
ncbi:GSCOCT00001705001.3-RA-CDS [Cotesia congregata]|uniref:Gustatory receptor n=1 Tax=Cotesia congregata TaxID=51543 RepID=A0A8J2MZA3_COTCN|nr:GSCOCT00001705001.3-RA-CDS [Cotesia congregata]CAG5107067.1 gustatory receptor 8 [Cotesia congregata]